MKKKILVMRYRFIGDTLLTVPFLRNLRNAYPDAQIDMLVAPVSGEIIEDCPYVNNFIYFDTTKKHRYENKDGQNKKDFWHYVKLLKEQKYDKAYVLKRSLSSAFLAFAAGIKERVGFDTEGRGFLLTKRIPYKLNQHEIESFLEILKKDNVQVKDDYLECWVGEKENEKVHEVLTKHGVDPNNKNLNIIVHATSGNRKKEWAKENWAKVIEWLCNEKNATVFFNGTKNDSSTYEEILSHIENNGNNLKNKPINLCGEFGLKETLAFTKWCSLIVGCDSGNLHIGAAAGIPVIGLYGPMNTEKWRAWGDNTIVIKTNLPCQPCSLKKKCKQNYRCVSDISISQVQKELSSMIDKL